MLWRQALCRLTPFSATLAPMQYIELPIATSIGWLIFGELPNGLAALGITLSVASGLAVIYFEHRALTRRPETSQRASPRP